MNEARRSRKEMLDWINVVSFAVDDVKLFLDSHPDCPEALSYFQEMKEQRNQALKEYADCFGHPYHRHRQPRVSERRNLEMGQGAWPWQEGGC